MYNLANIFYYYDYRFPFNMDLCRPLFCFLATCVHNAFLALDQTSIIFFLKFY